MFVCEFSIHRVDHASKIAEVEAALCQNTIPSNKYFQELSMMQMKTRHDQNLAEISSQLFKLQANLMTKERYLGQLIKEREQVGLFLVALSEGGGRRVDCQILQS